jgi:hypothetical protein
MSKNQKTELSDVEVMEVARGQVQFCILGTTPLIMHRMAQKAINELLLPKGAKSKADKAATLKHNPVEEYRNSVHQTQQGDSLLAMPSTAFKAGLSNAAIDIGVGVNKSQMGRLSYVEGEFVNIFGAPKLHMSIVRMDNMSRTPDVRTRACLPEWACRLTVSYIKPVINASIITRLLAGAGMMQGIGDFRMQKGKGSYGSFKLVDESDEDWQRIMRTQGRAVQTDALKNPECYDEDTTQLLEWFQNEVGRREMAKGADKKTKKEAEGVVA